MRPVALTTPTVTVFLKSPSGDPMAMTLSPGRNTSEFPNSAIPGKGGDTCNTAISENVSAPINLAGTEPPSMNTTSILSPPSMTWLLVSR